MRPTGNPRPSSAVVALFDRIAPIYDRMNGLMTLGIDRAWRSAAVRAAQVEPGASVLDVACGSGALTELLARRAGRRGSVVGIDRSAAMLRRARARATREGDTTTRYRDGDALALPFEAGRFDVVTIAFGLRNLTDFGGGLHELARVARPGGRIVVLEIAEPEGGVAALVYRTWFRALVPLLGRLAGAGEAYRYLPTSLEPYPSPREVAALMREAGMVEVRWRWLPTRMATLHVGIRGETAG